MGYEPKAGTGWVKGAPILEDVSRWRTPLGDGVYLQVTVALTIFTVSQTRDTRHTTPMPEDIQRIERDFGVKAWRIQGVFPVLTPMTGLCVIMEAVELS